MINSHSFRLSDTENSMLTEGERRWESSYTDFEVRPVYTGSSVPRERRVGVQFTTS